jgi:hypothetical protein
MKMIAIFGFVVALSFTAIVGTSHAGIVKLPYQTKGQLAAKCKAAVGEFSSDSASHSCYGKKGDVFCSKTNKKCIGDCPACGSKAATKSLPDILGQPKKRPKVLQQGGGGDEPDDVNPTVLGGGNPRKTPTGDMPDITGDGGIQ